MAAKSGPSLFAHAKDLQGDYANHVEYKGTNHFHTGEKNPTKTTKPNETQECSITNNSTS